MRLLLGLVLGTGLNMLMFQTPVPSYMFYQFTIRYADAETPTLAGSTLLTKFQPVPQQSVMLFKNGLIQGLNSDYTIANNGQNGVITFRNVQPTATDKFIVWYRY